MKFEKGKYFIHVGPGVLKEPRRIQIRYIQRDSVFFMYDDGNEQSSSISSFKAANSEGGYKNHYYYGPYSDEESKNALTMLNVVNYCIIGPKYSKINQK
jgi:hypothetical protein